MRKTMFVDIISVLLIVLFTYAAFSKIFDYEKFRVQLGQSPLLTEFAGFVAWALPVLEILIVLALMPRRIRLLGLYASLSLMVMFSAYIIAITQFGDYIPCSCGGILNQLSWNDHLLFNLLFVAISLTGVLLETKRITNESGITMQITQ